MIYQVKGISGYVWGVWGCVQVCAGVCRCVWLCAGVCGYARACMGMHKYTWHAQVCAGVRKCAQVFVEVSGSAWVSTSVCWMNFQNIFWRLESIHQRTLIRILYEFFVTSSCSIMSFTLLRKFKFGHSKKIFCSHFKIYSWQRINLYSSFSVLYFSSSWNTNFKYFCPLYAISVSFLILGFA